MAELGAGAGSGYPGAVDTKQVYVNGAAPIADSNARMDAEVLNDALDALVKIETELGVTPSGVWATIAARLDAFLVGSVAVPQLIVAGVGPHAIGGATLSNTALRLTGTLAGAAFGLGLDTLTLTPGSGSDAGILLVNGVTIPKAGSGTHVNFAGLDLRPFTIGAGAASVTNASTVRISDAPAGATNNYSLFVDAGAIRLDGSLWVEATPTEGTAGEQLTSGGAATVMDWTAAACVIESKQDIEVWVDPEDALMALLATPIYSFRYRDKNGSTTRPVTTGDRETQYVGPMAHEAPWAMHYGGRILNPINALGYTTLGIQALYKRMMTLEGKLAAQDVGY